MNIWKKKHNHKQPDWDWNEINKKPKTEHICTKCGGSGVCPTCGGITKFYGGQPVKGCDDCNWTGDCVCIRGKYP